MTGGDLSAEGPLSIEYVGYSGTGSFTQSGGTNSVAFRLYVGGPSGGNGTYHLNGSGQLSANEEYIDENGSFTQNGGTNTVNELDLVYPNSKYQFNGGLLQINGGVGASGIFVGGGGTLSGENCILNFDGTKLQNSSSMTLSLGTNSLLIVAQGFDPTSGTAFAHYSNLRPDPHYRQHAFGVGRNGFRGWGRH